jgi:DNA-binding HxlR family transcriptional regulator
MLRLNGQLHGLILWHLILGPQSIEQLKAQVATKRVLDHLAVTLAHTSCADLHPPQDLLV